MTKNELARVVIMVLYNLDVLPSADNCNVLTMAKGHKKPQLVYLHNIATRAIESTSPIR